MKGFAVPPPAPGGRAAIYARISHAPDGQTLGIERQVEDCRKRCEAMGWEVVEVFADNDVSAMKKDLGARPAGRRLVQAIEAGEIDALVAWSTDRIYRRVDELTVLVPLFDNIHVSTVTSGDVDLTTADGRLLARLLGSTAQHYSEKNAERIARKNLQLAQAGVPRRTGRRMFGFTLDRTAVVEEEAAVVRFLFKEFLAGMSLKKLAEVFQERVDAIDDSAIRVANTWRLRGLLTNPLYAGIIRYRGQIMGPATSPAIVDRADWERAVQILSDPARKSANRGPAGKLLITKVAKCAECGGRISGGWKKVYQRQRDAEGSELPRRVTDFKRPMYRCTQCGRTARSRLLVDAGVKALVISFIETNRYQLMPVAEPGRFNDELLEEIARKEGALRQLDDAMASGDLAAPDYGRMALRLREEIEVLEGKLLKASDLYPGASRLAQRDNLDDAWEALSDGARRDIVNELIERIHFGRAGRPGSTTLANITVEWKSTLGAPGVPVSLVG